MGGGLPGAESAKSPGPGKVLSGFLTTGTPSVRVREGQMIRLSGTRQSVSILLAVLLCISLAASCAGVFSTKIADIKANPRQYDGKTVVVAGEVKESANLLFMKYYVVKHDTGEITVITDRAVRRAGENVRVKGIVNQAFSLGDQSLVVIVEKRERDSG